ncbi:hypothetical protein DPMN_179922 [Dreissena polymorpha]|uniref:Death domain-containing protein n=1 Tax=Dreissena polymorpha TaxID=45954 RepID=A0A9D4EEZ8_DREPO|nr:hypothetical protein DPMN_179922 [Dreissena polymorpha]
MREENYEFDVRTQHKRKVGTISNLGIERRKQHNLNTFDLTRYIRVHVTILKAYRHHHASSCRWDIRLRLVLQTTANTENKGGDLALRYVLKGKLMTPGDHIEIHRPTSLSASYVKLSQIFPAKEFKMYFRQLKIDECTIQRIETEHPGNVREQCYKLFIEWEHRRTNKTKMSHLEWSFELIRKLKHHLDERLTEMPEFYSLPISPVTPQVTTLVTPHVATSLTPQGIRFRLVLQTTSNKESKPRDLALRYVLMNAPFNSGAVLPAVY